MQQSTCVCKIVGCDVPAGQARGWCRFHYRRWQKFGDPLAKPRNTACGYDPCSGTLPAGPDRRFCSKRCADAQYKIDNRDRLNAHSGAWVAANPDRRREIQKRYEDRNKGAISAARRAARASGRYTEYFREWRATEAGQFAIWASTLRTRYRMTPEQYQARLDAQGGRCAVCKRLSTETRRLAIDHDHRCCPGHKKSCGECIRGLLCTPCNNRLGTLEDAAWLPAALEYLKVTSILDLAQGGGTEHGR